MELRVVETSDMHGSFFPYDFLNHRPKAGSTARVSSYVNALRQQYGDRLLLFDNGDILQGQPLSYFSNFIDTTDVNIAAQVVNYLRYDAQTIGNHDIEPGHKVYDKWMSEVKCPVLGANIIDTKTGQPYAKPYAIIERNGVRIAVLGMLTPAIPNWLSPDIWSGLRFDDMVATARRWMPVLRNKEKADVVIGLFHSGKEGGITTDTYMEDASEVVAREVPGFDLVLFGHDHTRHNDTVTNTAGHQVVCLDPANNAMSVADARICLSKANGKWTVDSIRGSINSVANLPIDQAYEDHFKAYINKVNRFNDEPIGTFKHTIRTADCYFGNSAFNDLILNLELSITGADIAFTAPLLFNDSIKAGPVAMSDMFKLYKYENMLYVMRLTGEEIRKHLEMSYDLWFNTMTGPDDHLLLLDRRTGGDAQRMGFKNLSFNFDSAAGIDYTVDVTKPNGQKVTILRMSNGQPFEPKRWYRVAINSYRANGGGELLTRGAGIPKDSLASRIVWKSDRDQRYYLMQEIKRQKVLDPQPNHNWKVIPEDWTAPAAKRDRDLLFSHHTTK
ncbi:MAG: bifunctional metallophosphatase/5'-nucleotidase [Prevotella sp.]|nr:bifunctional metallophosphatase/5'-nucleotidase [Prevotella sp.]